MWKSKEIESWWRILMGGGGGRTLEVLQVQNFSADLSFIDLTTFTDHILQILKTSWRLLWHPVMFLHCHKTRRCISKLWMFHQKFEYKVRLFCSCDKFRQLIWARMGVFFRKKPHCRVISVVITGYWDMMTTSKKAQYSNDSNYLVGE